MAHQPRRMCGSGLCVDLRSRFGRREIAIGEIVKQGGAQAPGGAILAAGAGGALRARNKVLRAA